MLTVHEDRLRILIERQRNILGAFNSMLNSLSHPEPEKVSGTDGPLTAKPSTLCDKLDDATNELSQLTTQLENSLSRLDKIIGDNGGPLDARTR